MLLHALQVFQGIHTRDRDIVGDHHADGMAMPQNPQLFQFFNLLSYIIAACTLKHRLPIFRVAVL